MRAADRELHLVRAGAASIGRAAGAGQSVAPSLRAPQASILAPTLASSPSRPASAISVTPPGRPSLRAGVGTASPHSPSRLTKLV